MLGEGKGSLENYFGGIPPGNMDMEIKVLCLETAGMLFGMPCQPSFIQVHQGGYASVWLQFLTCYEAKGWGLCILY